MSDNFRQELVKNFDKYLIDIDDTFAFKCRRCGKCCKNREDILLNARDLYNIAVKLNMSILQVGETYCDVYIGDSSRVPIIRLKPRGVNKVCPLSSGDRCSVHDAKPAVCALFPLGRVAVNDKYANAENRKPLKIGYILNPIQCGSIKRKQTVRSWIERFNIPADDPFFIEWNNIIISLSESMIRFEKNKATEKSLELMWNGIYSALYLSYDPEKDFMPQFLENSDKILKLIAGLETIFNGIINKATEGD